MANVILKDKTGRSVRYDGVVGTRLVKAGGGFETFPLGGSDVKVKLLPWRDQVDNSVDITDDPVGTRYLYICHRTQSNLTVLSGANTLGSVNTLQGHTTYMLGRLYKASGSQTTITDGTAYADNFKILPYQYILPNGQVYISNTNEQPFQTIQLTTNSTNITPVYQYSRLGLTAATVPFTVETSESFVVLLNETFTFDDLTIQYVIYVPDGTTKQILITPPSVIESYLNMGCLGTLDINPVELIV